MDRAMLAHFGNDEALMDGLLMRFSDTVQTTLTKIKLALQATHSQDFVCYIYQIRGAASWICAGNAVGRIGISVPFGKRRSW